jgi:hypothetical protein
LTDSLLTIQPLYTVVTDSINKQSYNHRNKNKSWKYGYDDKYDIIVISKNGTIGEVYCINGVNIALPKQPFHIEKKNNKWKAAEYPKELAKIKKMAEWNKKDNAFKTKWIDYIEKEFDRREEGFWFMNNGKPTYITGSHYMYLQWSKIDVGLPDFREANRIFYIFWEACKADPRCFGICYLKIRRSGFSFMGAEECNNIGTSIKDGHVGIMSKRNGRPYRGPKMHQPDGFTRAIAKHIAAIRTETASILQTPGISEDARADAQRLHDEVRLTEGILHYAASATQRERR